MADSMNVTGNASNIDISRWKKLSAQEILKQESKGEEIPSEIVSWAEQMAALAKIPDDVTYEQVDGDVGLDALDKLGISPEDAGFAVAPEVDNAQNPTKPEQPDAVKDPAKIADLSPESQDNNIFMNATPGQAGDVKPQDTNPPDPNEQQTLTLADPALTTDPEEIRKRKAKKGLA